MPIRKETPDVKSVEFKKSVSRSAAYPAYTIAYARDLTQNIYTNFGLSGFVSRETIAKILKKSPEYLKQPISTCVQYGLLEMKSGIGYKPSSRFMDMYKQDDPIILRSALLSCFKEPKLYANLIEIYAGDILPSLAVLSNALFKKHNIVENTAEKAASVFLQNVEDLGLVTQDRKLIGVGKGADEVISITHIEEFQEDQLPVENLQSMAQKNEEKSNDLSFIVEVPLQYGRKAKISCPIDVNEKDWKKIIRVLKSYIEVDEEDN